MDHIFDNRHYLQSIVVTGGNKISVSPPSDRHSIKFEDAERIFFQHFSDSESEIIKTYLILNLGNETPKETISLWCDSVLENALRNYRQYDLCERTSLRELFIERVLSHLQAA
jgi:hypothetical protein